MLVLVVTDKVIIKLLLASYSVVKNQSIQMFWEVTGMPNFAYGM
jgi:hypothetical protein